MSKKIKKFALIMAAFSVLLISMSQAKYPYLGEARETTNYYIDLVSSSNYESAQGLWHPESIKQARRLGIEYKGIVFKPDCLSPAIYLIDELRDGKSPGFDSQASINDTTLRFRFRIDMRNHDPIYFPYYVTRTGGYSWIVYPHDVLMADYKTIESKYYVFHIHPDLMKTVNEVAIGEMDRLLEKMASILDIKAGRLKNLAEQKVHYYLCRTEGEIMGAAGVQSGAAYRPDADVVFSRFLTDLAPVADLLINYKMQTLNPGMNNFMRTALRTYLAGGRQRTADVYTDFGEYILEYQVIDIDTLLEETYKGDKNMEDIALPAQACLAEYMISRFGLENYLTCLDQLTGIEITEDSLRAKITKEIVAAALGTEWSSLESGLNDYVLTRPMHGGAIFPGEIKAKDEIINKDNVRLAKSNEYLQVVYNGGDDRLFNINILFGKDSLLVDKPSQLLAEQLVNPKPYIGYRYGLRFDKNEIGLYDYAINKLIAKYVSGFDPSDEYYNPETNGIKAYFDLELLGAELPDFSDNVFIQ